MRCVGPLRLRQDAAHIFGSQLGVLIDEVQAHRLPVDHRQRMAQLEARVAVVPDIEQAQRFRQGFLIAFHRDAIGTAIVFAAVMP